MLELKHAGSMNWSKANFISKNQDGKILAKSLDIHQKADIEFIPNKINIYHKEFLSVKVNGKDPYTLPCGIINMGRRDKHKNEVPYVGFDNDKTKVYYYGHSDFRITYEPVNEHKLRININRKIGTLHQGAVNVFADEFGNDDFNIIYYNGNNFNLETPHFVHKIPIQHGYKIIGNRNYKSPDNYSCLVFNGNRKFYLVRFLKTPILMQLQLMPADDNSIVVTSGYENSSALKFNDGAIIKLYWEKYHNRSYIRLRKFPNDNYNPANPIGEFL